MRGEKLISHDVWSNRSCFEIVNTCSHPFHRTRIIQQPMLNLSLGYFEYTLDQALASSDAKLACPLKITEVPVDRFDDLRYSFALRRDRAQHRRCPFIRIDSSSFFPGNTRRIHGPLEIDSVMSGHVRVRCAFAQAKHELYVVPQTVRAGAI